MWSQFVENPFNLQNLYLGIIVILLIIVGYFHRTVQVFFYSLREKEKRLKDYLIITLGILWLVVFLYSCYSYESTLGEGDSNPENNGY